MLRDQIYKSIHLLVKIGVVPALKVKEAGYFYSSLPAHKPPQHYLRKLSRTVSALSLILEKSYSYLGRFRMLFAVLISR